MNKGVRTLFLLFVAAAVACGGPDLELSVTFAETDGLEPGDPVFYKGLKIGKVDSISLDEGGIRAGLEIDSEHRSALYRESEFVMERTVTGGRKIVVHDVEGERTAIDDGDLLDGRTTSLGDLATKIGALGRDLLERGADRMGTQLDSWRQKLGETDEGNEFLDSARDAAARAREMTAERYELFQEEELPKLERRAVDMRDWLIAQGRKADSEKFWKDFQKWAADLRDKAAADGD